MKKILRMHSTAHCIFMRALAVCFLLSLSTSLFAQTTRHIDLNTCYDDFALSLANNGRYLVSTQRKDMSYSSDTDLPAIPFFTVNVLVGTDEVFEDCELTAVDSLVKQGIVMATSLIFHSADTADSVSLPSNRMTHRMSIVKSVEFLGTHTMDGYCFLSFAVCPFSYDPSTESLYFRKGLSIHVSTKGRKSAKIVSAVGNNMRSIVKDKVANPEELSLLYPYTKNARATAGDISYKYIIVTNESLRPSFEALAAWKTMKGIRTKILTTDSIYTLYPGATQQEKIKRALADYYNGSHTGLEYVLLGGDVDIVPVRMCYIYEQLKHIESSTPSDLYYACLDDMSWDGNGNGIYAELDDAIDDSPEIFVTRMPVKNAAHVKAFTDRVIEYERNPKADFWHNNILMGGCKMDTVYTENGAQVSDAQLQGSHIYDNYIMPTWTGNRVRFYDTATDFVGGDNYNFIADNLQSQMTMGYNFVDIETHGYKSSWSMEGNSYTASKAASLSNDGYTIIFTTACLTNAFDMSDPCLSEAFLRNPDSGVLAYVGCSREGWNLVGNQIGPSGIIDAQIYDLLFSKAETSFGRVTLRGKCTHNLNNYYYTGFRWVFLAVNPLGDPEMPIYTSAPQHFDNVEITIANGEVRATSNIPGCRFCFMDRNDNSFYYVCDSSSTASIQNMDGVYQICITKPGYIPYIAIVGYDIALQNESVDYPIHVFANNKSFMGSNVNSDVCPGPVVVNNRGSLTVRSKKGTTLDKGFSVELGGTLDIDK